MRWNLCPHKICTRRFNSIFIYSCKTWKQTICSSRDKWINICSTSLQWNSILKKKKEIQYQAKKRRKQCIFLSERNQSEKATYSMIPTIWYSGKKKKTIKKITRSVVERGGNRRRRDKWTKPRRFLWQWTILYDAALVANNRMNNTKCES